jgi:hypothetical protein
VAGPNGETPGRPEGLSDGAKLIAGRQRARPDTRTKTPRPKPQAKSADADRQTRTIAGWQVHISLKLLAEQKAETEKALELLQGQLDEIVRVVPKPALAELQKVSLWVSPEYPGVKPTAEYHPDAGWLREHGRPVAMAKSVEFTNIRMFEAETKRMPNFALHELAHAYHDRVLGFENAEIQAVYEKAKAAKTYDAVERWLGPGRPKTKERAYAMTNAKEYFAETTEAFFSRNDFFPFTRDELAQHDPEMLALLKRLWRVLSIDETAWKRHAHVLSGVLSAVTFCTFLRELSSPYPVGQRSSADEERRRPAHHFRAGPTWPPGNSVTCKAN